MAAQSLYDLLHFCVVFVSVPARKVKGTGFFVAPGKVLTCAHVVEAAQQQKLPIEITWNGQTLPAQIQQFRDVETTDLALLDVNLTDHPCVLLYGGAQPQNHLYSFGFPDIEPQGASTTFKSEGWAGSQLERLKFQQGQARPGMSGSPLLNWDTGGVCGIVQLSYSTSTVAAVGGSGLLTKNILQEFPELQEQQKQYHQQHREWIDSLDALQRPRVKLDWLVQTPAEPLEVFTSYSEKDKVLHDELMKHLKQMKREKLITGYDHNLDVGTEKEDEVKKRLDRARIILLLVSPDFLDSDYHYDVEMKEALERHNARAACVIPIMLRPTSDWNRTEFAKIQSLPRDNNKTVADLNRDRAFADIAGEIRKVVDQLKNPQSAH